jgi:hypothetical protein
MPPEGTGNVGAMGQNVSSSQCLALCPPPAEVPWMEVAKVTGSLAGPFLGVPVLFFGIWQYRVAQRWKRNEFAASFLKELNSDPDLVACCNVLDYPKRCIVLAHQKTKDDKPTILEHDRQKLPAAMAISPPDDGFAPEQIVYRDLFDRMCSYLSQVANACSQKLIAPTDVRPLHYWLERILDVHGLADSSVLAGFVKRYHPGVIALAELFEKKKLLSLAATTALARWNGMNR